MMHGLGNMHNGGNGMPAGVKMPRRRPVMWCNNDSYVALPLNVGNYDITDQFTLCAWCFLSGGSGTQRGIYGNIWLNSGYHIRITTDNRIRVIVAENATNWKFVDSNSIFPLLQWHHIAAKFLNLADLRLYIDGTQVQNPIQSSGTVTTIQTTNPHYIGALFEQPAYQWYGVISDVRNYNRILSGDELARLARHKEIDNTGLQGHWKGNGITNDNWRDLSGNEHHGTVVGTPERALNHVRDIVIRTNPVTQTRYRVN